MIFVLSTTLTNATFSYTTTLQNSFSQRPDTLDPRIQMEQDSLPKEQGDEEGKEQGQESSDFIQTEIDYTANDSIVMSRVNNKIFLYKEAKVTYGNIELTADYIEYNQDSNTVFARGVKDSTGKFVGQPVFKEGEKAYDAETIRYNFKTKEGYIKNVVTEEEDGFLHGETTKKHTNNHFHFKDGKYTTCDKDHPHFYISISKGMVVPNEQIVAGPSYLVIEDIPLPIGIPFGLFPIQKKQSSGIVIGGGSDLRVGGGVGGAASGGGFGEESERGFYMKDVGYYFGISDNMDLKLLGSVYSKGSWGVRMDYNYIKRYKFSSKLSLDYKRLVTGDKGSPDYVSQRDYSIIWRHSQAPKANPYSSFNASVNYSSTSYDKFHAENSQDYTNNTKTSNISYSKQWPGSPFNFTGKLRHNQNSRNNTVNLTLPEMSFNMSRQYPLRQFNKSGRSKWYDDVQLSYDANLRNQIQSPDSTLFKNTTYSDFESGFQHRIPLSLNFKVLKYLNITPNVNYKGILYPRYIERSWNPQTQSVVEDTVEDFRYAQSVEPALSMSISPKIFGMFQFTGENSKVQAIRHVMTPSVSFNFRPSLGAMTARYYDEYQVDTTGKMREYSIFDGQLYSPPSSPQKSGNIGLGLSNNVEMKVRSESDTTNKPKKVTLLNQLSFNSGYNIFADSLNWSAISINGRTTLFENNISLNFGGSLDPYALDDNGSRVDEFEWSKNGNLGRLTRVNASVNMNLGPGGKNAQGESEGGSGQGNGGRSFGKNRYDYFYIPWSLSVGYNFNYSKPRFESNVTQTVSLSGNFSLTDKWRFNFSTHYDIAEEKFSTTWINITRDLHCWTMTFRWVPFGLRQHYNFKISVNSSVLQDLQLKKRNSWYDNL